MDSPSSKDEQFVGAIDQGTTSTRFFLFNSKAQVVHYHQMEFEQIKPKSGWVEHDPLTILKSVTTCIDEVMKKCSKQQINNIKAIGITNQRETTVVWDKTTGKPLHNAIVWLDTRNASTCAKLLERVDNNKDYFREKSGLPIATYFSATKLKWLLEEVPEVKKASEEGRCLFGTVDSWLMWNLTGGVNGGVHVTDVTNASRTMLMNLKTLKWDSEVCKFLDIPMSVLPAIKSSAEVYGSVSEGPLGGVPIAGCLGDQQAAMVGQHCLQKGEAKNTYGTGCFMLFNTGEEVIPSTHGLLTTVCYQLGKDKPTVYALEGSVAIAGAAINWLRDNFGIIKESSEITDLANTVQDCADTYFVPAFSGLFAPYWRSDARGVIVGLTQYTNKGHLARAVLESVCFQTREVLDAMRKDSGTTLTKLKVDGGMTKSELMLQIQSDLIGIPVLKPNNSETTVLGAAYAAGIATGVWSEDKLPTLGAQEYLPSIPESNREQRLASWKKAVERSFNWT